MEQENIVLQESSNLPKTESPLHRTGKLLLGIGALWCVVFFALPLLHISFFVAGTPGILVYLGLLLGPFALIGIPTLFIAGFVMIFTTNKKIVVQKPNSLSSHKSDTRDLVFVSVIFLIGVIVPMTLAANYRNFHPEGIVPDYILLIAFFTNITAFILSFVLLRREKAQTRFIAGLLIFFSALYFCFLLLSIVLSGFVG